MRCVKQGSHDPAGLGPLAAAGRDQSWCSHGELGWKCDVVVFLWGSAGPGYKIRCQSPFFIHVFHPFS